MLAVNLVRSDGSPAPTGHYLVDVMPQSDLPSVEEHFIASALQVPPLVGLAALELGDILGVTHAPLLSVPLDVLQQDSRAPNAPSRLSKVSPALTYSFLPRRSSLALACTA